MSNNETYTEIKSRLDEIVEAVSDENIPLDDALKLYEEAVSLGSKISDAIENDIAIEDSDSDTQVNESQESPIA